jgi:hypothetical protein
VTLGALVSAVLLRRRRSREAEPRVAMRRV